MASIDPPAPSATDQSTDRSAALLTSALNCWVCSGSSETAAGRIATATSLGGGPPDGGRPGSAFGSPPQPTAKAPASVRAPREPKTHVPLRRRKGGNGTAGSAVPAQAALFDRGPRRKEAHGALSQ